MDQHVPAFAERDECDTVQTDQIIQQGVIVVGLVHDQIINQAESQGIKQEPVDFQALGRLLPESHK